MSKMDVVLSFLSLRQITILGLRIEEGELGYDRDLTEVIMGYFEDDTELYGDDEESGLIDHVLGENAEDTLYDFLHEYGDLTSAVYDFWDKVKKMCPCEYERYAKNLWRTYQPPLGSHNLSASTLSSLRLTL